MAKADKKYGRIYTPKYLVQLILDFGEYNNSTILKKHVIDNSCGDGAFLVEIVERYCSLFLNQNDDLSLLKNDLEIYIHGIELDETESKICVSNLNKCAEQFGLSNIEWDILTADTLRVDKFEGKMDYVFGNPPYVRVHNLDNNYDDVKKFYFAESGMVDLFIVFFEIGFKMLASNGIMSLITPSSWLKSKAGKNLRDYIVYNENISGIIDLEHFQPFNATTYTLISKFQKSQRFRDVEYNTFDITNMKKVFQSKIPLNEIHIGNEFYISTADNIAKLKEIKTHYFPQHVVVKNGFATLADKIFIGNFDFKEGTIDILKASNGKWSKCIYPYDKNGYPLSIDEFMKFEDAYNYLLPHKDKLAKGRNIEIEKYWYLFGRTQALKDVSVIKYAINTIVKDLNSIRLEKVLEGKGIYSGLYILTEIDFEIIKEIIYSADFISYVKLLKNYKSGGYYTFTSKDLEQYLNYKLTEKYGQSKISRDCKRLF